MVSLLNFIKHLENHQSSPLLVSIIKKTTIKKDKHTNKFVFLCPNQGIKMFLESKQSYITRQFNNFSDQKTELVFMINEKRLKKINHKVLPLVEYQKKTVDLHQQAGLSPQYTFKNFAVSNSNQLAYSAALSITQNPGKFYNPLFVYGGVGVGKTHLAQATAHNIIEKNNKALVLFCTSEEFTNDLIDLIQKKNTQALRKKYRNLDVLVVDDIQFIAGKNYVQEEFFHTFNSIIKKGGQIILTSDRPPKEILKLEDRLVSRFSGGLLIDVQKPDFELRTAIVLIKARQRNIDIELEAAKKIAENITDARELEGCLLKLFTKTLSNGNKVTINLARQELSQQGVFKGRQKSPSEVVLTVADFFGLNSKLIKSNSRKSNIAQARQVVMYILRTSFEMKLEDIAFYLKKKDHTTIMYGVDKIAKRVLKDPGFKKDINNIISLLKQ